MRGVLRVANGIGTVRSATSHIIMALSTLALARGRPSGLNPTQSGEPVWPDSVASSAGWNGSAISHSTIVWLLVPAARVRPSGLKASALAVYLEKSPLREIVRIRVGVDGCVTSHSVTVYASATAMVRPSGLNAIAD